MNQENTINSPNPLAGEGIKTEYSQEEVDKQLQLESMYRKCKNCNKKHGLRKAVSDGQIFYLCHKCYEKDRADGTVEPFDKFNKKEQKALKRQRAKQLKGLV